jgi:signal peptidase I
MKHFFSRLCALLGLLILLYAVISVRPYRVSGDSMSPTLDREQIVLIDRFSRHFVPLRRGEIIVYSDINTTEKVKIKRLVGFPGEKLQIMDGKVLLDSAELEERYLTEHVRTCLPGSCVNLSPYEYSIPAD